MARLQSRLGFALSRPLSTSYALTHLRPSTAANPIWRLLGHPCSPAAAWQAETGQILVNKRARRGMNLVALEVARAMMREEGFWFRLSGGDKDLFVRLHNYRLLPGPGLTRCCQQRFAFLFLSLPYSLAPHYPSALGGPMLARTYKGHLFCGHTMVQYGLDAEREWAHLRSTGRLPPRAPHDDDDDNDEASKQHAPPLFVHANALKHTGYTHRRGSTFITLKRPLEDRLLGPPSSASRWSRPAAPLEAIRQAGLPTHGICIDVWDASARNGAREQVEDAREGAYEEGGVAVERWEEAWGGLGRGFEEMYYAQGGVAGAW